jgi:Subtilase family
MGLRTVSRSALALLFSALVTPAWAINVAIPAIHGDVSRTLLGDGTGTIIGIVDSGVDDTHPALAGLDSLGHPRMVAEANFVPTEPGNTGDDVFGHGTWLASILVSRDPVYTGLATDARFVNARVLDSGGGYASDVQVRNGIGFAIGQGADVLNISMNYNDPVNSGNTQFEYMLDWAAFNRGISCAVCVANIPPPPPAGSGYPNVRGPGSGYNGIVVGRVTSSFDRVDTNSATSFTADGRMKPDVVAPGSNLTLANSDWEGAAPDWEDNYFGRPLSGCSFATPMVAGLIAQQVDAGRTHGLSIDPLVIKATVMNSAINVLDKLGNPWTPGTPGSITNVGGVTHITQPLDTDSGTGIVDGARLSTQYLAGELGPGPVGAVGWDLNSIANSQFIDYAINPSLILGSTLNATLSWYRHVGRTDNGNGIIDAGDSFNLLQQVSNLDLQVLHNGTLVAESASGLDNVEHLQWNIDQAGQYTLRVRGANVFGGSEQFALAWYGAAVPEPASWILLLGATLALGTQRRRAARTPRREQFRRIA